MSLLVGPARRGMEGTLIGTVGPPLGIPTNRKIPFPMSTRRDGHALARDLRSPCGIDRRVGAVGGRGLV